MDNATDRKVPNMTTKTYTTDDCQGHPSDEYGEMGITQYCDGSCQRLIDQRKDQDARDQRKDTEGNVMDALRVLGERSDHSDGGWHTIAQMLDAGLLPPDRLGMTHYYLMALQRLERMNRVRSTPTNFDGSAGSSRYTDIAWQIV